MLGGVPQLINFVPPVRNVQQWPLYSAGCRYSAGNTSTITATGKCRKHQHYNVNRHYSACCHCWLFPLVPSDFTGTIAGDRRYSTGAIEVPLLLLSKNAAPRLPLGATDLFCDELRPRSRPLKPRASAFSIGNGTDHIVVPDMTL